MSNSANRFCLFQAAGLMIGFCRTNFCAAGTGEICQDKNSNCAMWVQTGQCRGSGEVKVQSDCPLGCNVCNDLQLSVAVSPESCINLEQPAGTRSCTVECSPSSTTEYSWSASEWAPCSATCGAGTRTRSVYAAVALEPDGFPARHSCGKHCSHECLVKHLRVQHLCRDVDTESLGLGSLCGRC